MDITNKLMAIASLMIAIAGCLFLGVSIFGGENDTSLLAVALGCICLANLFNAIRLHHVKAQS